MRDYGGAGQPRAYGPPQRPVAESEDQPFESGARHSARAVVPGQRDNQRDNQPGNDWDSDRDDAPSWHQRNEPPVERTPGLYGHGAATSSPGPQPLYGGAPPVPSASPAGVSSGPPSAPTSPPGLPTSAPGQPTSPPRSDLGNNGRLAGEPSINGANSPGANSPGVDGPSPNAFGPGVYGAGVYGAATYGTRRDADNDVGPSRNGDRAEPGRNGYGDPAHSHPADDRPAAARSADASGSEDRHRDGGPANDVATPEVPPARPAGGVYGTPRLYGAPRPTPEDDADDASAGLGSVRDANRFDDANRFNDQNRFNDPNRFDDPNRVGDRPGPVSDLPSRPLGDFPSRPFGDLPARPFGEIPGRAVADMAGRAGSINGSASISGFGRPTDAADRTRADEVAPRSPVGQTYGSSRPPTDWGGPESDQQARFDSPFAPAEGVRIPTGTSSFAAPGSLGEAGRPGASPATDGPGRAAEPRRRARMVGIVALVVIVIGLAAGALYYTSRPNAPSYQIGACVQHTGEKVNGSACTAPNSFKIVSKVSDPNACPNANDPYLYLDSDKSTVYCLSPN